MMTDIEIAQAAVPQPISEIADAAGIPAARMAATMAFTGRVEK